MSKRTLVVFEGPAGSGKTTLISSQFASKGYEFLGLRNQLSIDRPRSYDGRDGARLAQIKDQVTTADFIYSSSPVCITDRWYLSRWVYGSIRGDVTYTPRDIIRLGMRDILYQAEAASLSGFHDDNRIDVDLRLVFFFPTPELLTELRAKAPRSREYPFEASRELELYHTAYEEIIGHSNKSRPALFGFGNEAAHVRLVASSFVYSSLDFLSSHYLHTTLSALIGVTDDVASPQ